VRGNKLSGYRGKDTAWKRVQKIRASAGGRVGEKPRLPGPMRTVPASPEGLDFAKLQRGQHGDDDEKRGGGGSEALEQQRGSSTCQYSEHQTSARLHRLKGLGGSGTQKSRGHPEGRKQGRKFLQGKRRTGRASREKGAFFTL